jgi:hypothetical protein
VEPNPLQVTSSGLSPTSGEMRLTGIRCSCPKTGDPDSDRLLVMRIHGFQADGKNLKACPKPALVEPDMAVITWKRATLTQPIVLFLVFALGAAAAIAAHQLWALVPMLIGATLQVNGGRAIVTNRIKGAGTEPLNLGWGTAAGTTAAADTTLFTEKLVDLATSAGTDHTVGTSTQQTTSTTNDTYQVIATRTATGAGTVTNAGLFDAASGGNLYMKGDFTGIGLAIGDAIQFTCKVQYT